VAGRCTKAVYKQHRLAAASSLHASKGQHASLQLLSHEESQFGVRKCSGGWCVCCMALHKCLSTCTSAQLRKVEPNGAARHIS
jgi:hypothetical protein